MDKKQCIEPKQVIRVIHKDLLTDWRDSVVRRGMRTYLASDTKTYTMSLTRTCMNCHTDKGEFCDQCHNYMGVKPRCWDCHNYPKGIQGNRWNLTGRAFLKVAGLTLVGLAAKPGWEVFSKVSPSDPSPASGVSAAKRWAMAVHLEKCWEGRGMHGLY